MKVYQVNGNVDYPTAAEAIAAVEAAGKPANVVKFYLERNMPNRLPEYVHRSTAMWVYEEGTWTQRSIFSGTSEPIGMGRPD